MNTLHCGKKTGLSETNPRVGLVIWRGKREEKGKSGTSSYIKIHSLHSTCVCQGWILFVGEWAYNSITGDLSRWQPSTGALTKCNSICYLPNNRNLHISLGDKSRIRFQFAKIAKAIWVSIKSSTLNGNCSCAFEKVDRRVLQSTW